MDTSDKELREHLVRIARELTELASGITNDSTEVVFPASAAAKVAKRICLDCGELVPLNKRYVRGLDSACEAAARDRINKKLTTESELIAKGLLAPGDPGGRKRRKTSEIQKFIESKNDVNEQYSDENARAVARRAVAKALELSNKAKKKRQKK